jgi:Protein of unknown function, DUF417
MKHRERIPFFTHGPLVVWMYKVFGMKGSTYLLGVSEWLFGALLLAGFWNKKLGILGAFGSVLTCLCTVTIIPCMPDGWAPSAGGFPAMGRERGLSDERLGSACRVILLLKQDVVRVTHAAKHYDLVIEPDKAA